MAENRGCAKFGRVINRCSIFIFCGDRSNHFCVAGGLDGLLVWLLGFWVTVAVIVGLRLR